MTELTPTSDTDISGGCRCGQVRFSVTRAPLFAGYCHCNACRQRSSASCTAFLMMDEPSFTLVGETHSYRETGGSGAPIEHKRCSQCGSTIYTKLYVLKNTVALPAALLDDKSVFRPQQHVWVSAKQDWFEISDDLPQQPGPPQLSAELMARLPSR